MTIVKTASRQFPALTFEIEFDEPTSST